MKMKKTNKKNKMKKKKKKKNMLEKNVERHGLKVLASFTNHFTIMNDVKMFKIKIYMNS